jgi:Flp pilus assembly protein TadG
MLNRFRRERGQDLIEFALVMPLLFLMVFGILEFALVFFTYNTIADAARDGARYGVIGVRSISDTAGIVATVYEVTDAANLSRAKLTVTSSQPTATSVRVDVAYQMDLISWLTGSPGVTLRAASTKKIELE